MMYPICPEGEGDCGSSFTTQPSGTEIVPWPPQLLCKVPTKALHYSPSIASVAVHRPEMALVR